MATYYTLVPENQILKLNKSFGIENSENYMQGREVKNLIPYTEIFTTFDLQCEKNPSGFCNWKFNPSINIVAKNICFLLMFKACFEGGLIFKRESTLDNEITYVYILRNVGKIQERALAYYHRWQSHFQIPQTKINLDTFASLVKMVENGIVYSEDISKVLKYRNILNSPVDYSDEDIIKTFISRSRPTVIGSFDDEDELK